MSEVWLFREADILGAGSVSAKQKQAQRVSQVEQAALLLLDGTKPSTLASARNGVVSGFGGGKRFLTDPGGLRHQPLQTLSQDGASAQASLDTVNNSVDSQNSGARGSLIEALPGQEAKVANLTATKPDKSGDEVVHTRQASYSFGRAGMDSQLSPCVRGRGRYAPSMTSCRLRTFRERRERDIPPGMPKKRAPLDADA
eukprot:TRINITY_DN45906_c0_g1_i2.p1 TRINITY_DN45906_c0_g1~~TRINITY_DN45906_c0_g1_i2.p1  ORF type:complete len:199 (-),score=39.19 TRINITY_DN45906_c0_g1_i2:172-768(-)